MTEPSKVDAAIAAAEAAATAARNAAAAQEVEMLSNVTRISELTANRTAHEANRLKSRYITCFGFDRWQKLCSDSR